MRGHAEHMRRKKSTYRILVGKSEVSRTFGRPRCRWDNGSHSLTHGAELFLRSCQLCSHSKTSQRFMEPEDSFPCSQERSIGPYPEPHRSNPYHPILSKIHFNVIHPPTSWASQWSPSFRLSHQYPICIPPSPIRATYPAHLILLDLIILIIWIMAVKMNFKGKGYGGIKWVYLTQDGDQ
jgi:hypothetical protein